MKRIIVCPDDFKKKRLADLYTNKMLNEDFYITIDSLKEKMFFEIDSNAVMYTRDFLNIKYSVAASLIKNIYYINNTNFKHDNITMLKTLKKELENNNLLKYDDFFKHYISRYDVVVMGYVLSKKDMLVIDEVRKYTNVEIEEVTYKETTLEVTEYSYIETEIDNFFNNVIKLVNKGVKLNNIKLCNTDSSYIHLLRRYSSFYNIKLNFKKNDSIIANPIVTRFLELYKTNKDLSIVVDTLKEEFYNNDIIKKLISLINKHSSNKDLTDVFLYEFEKIKFDELRYDNAIEVVDFYNYEFDTNDHVFMLNFNSGVIPKEFKDDDYLNDIISTNLNIDTTADKIKLELDNIKLKLYTINNLYISYKLKSKSKEFIPSRLVSNLEMKVNKCDNKYNNSTTKIKLDAALMLEDYINYHIYNEDINKYYYLIEEEFKTYSNKYTKVDEELIKKRLDNKIKLSYTSLSTFYKCNFQYYLERVLKLRVEDINFSADIGTIFHEVLERLYEEDFNIEEYLDSHKDDFTTNQQLYYYNKLRNEFMSTIDIIKKQKEYTSLDKELYEHNVLIEDEVKFKREFVGLVDKVIYRKTPNHDYIAVIDYKSGYIKSTIDNVEDGFNLQLPIYAYMLKKSTKFNNPIVLGIFLQKILHATPKYDSKKSREQIENENLLLQGYAIGTDNIEMLDKTYEESKLIAKMKLNSKGDIDRYARVLTEDEFEDLATTVEELMSNAYNKIEDMNFEINPKIIKKENKSCTYCKYESICYKRIEDNVYIESEDKADVNELD